MPKNNKPSIIEDIAYKAVVNVCNLVAKSKGEKLAHSVAKNISIAFLSKDQLKLYTAIGKLQSKNPDGVSTAQLSKATGIPAGLIPSKMSYLYKRTRLLEVTFEGRNRLWKQT